jgi:iron complex outermembrane receptor protein
MKRNNNPPVLCFRRWKRTPYAAFASIGKVVKIGVLCVACSLITMRAQPAIAQSVPGVATAGDTLRELDETVITGERPPQFLSLMQVVAIIRQSDIERAPVQNLQDLLRYLEGIDLRARGNNNVQADISLRGGTFDQTVILLNGVNITDPQTGHYSLDIPLNLHHVKRIEVLQGPGAWSSGAAAYCGAINIITEVQDSSGAAIGLAQGAHRYQSYDLAGHLAAKGFRATASAHKSQSAGFTENTDFDLENLYLQLRYASRHSGTWHGQFGYQHKSYGANSFYTASYPNQFDHTETFLSSLRYHLEKKHWSGALTLYHRQHYDRFELFRHNAPAWYTGHNYHRTDLAGALAQLHHASKAGTTTAGFNYRFEHIFSNKLGEPLHQPFRVKGERAANALYLYEKTRMHLSGFLQHTFHRRWFHATAGLMAAGNSDFGFRLYAGGNLSFDLHPHWQLKTALSNSYRLPTFTDLYYTSVTQQGNPGLQPEEALNTELSLLYRRTHWRATLGGFYRYGYRTIDWIRRPNETVWQAQNLTHVTAAGANLLVEYIPEASFLQRAALSYAYVHVASATEEWASAYATDQLRHRLSGTLQHRIWQQLAASWQLSYQQRAGAYLDLGTNTEKPFRAFWLCDLKIYWETPHYNLFAEATNLFNTQYFDFGNIPQPGRWIKLGVNIKIF